MDYFEKDLEVPFLQVLSENKNGLPMSSIKTILMQRLEPSGTSAEPSPTRKGEIKLHQRIGNFTPLRERRIFTRGYATYDQEKGIYKITDKGEKFLKENEGAYEYLISQGFTRIQREKEVERDFKDLIIEEGTETKITSKQRKRSQLLRQEKIKEIKEQNNGKISCIACGFDFSVTYDGHGEGYIEIHHLEPVSLMDRGGSKRDLKDALKKVVPLCSNCHRMVHRNKEKTITIKELKKIIQEQKV